MSHDQEAEVIATALWDTHIPTWGDAVDMASALAAAGYTVTKGRYEEAPHPCIYCTGQFCANAGSGSKPCCPDCSGQSHHVRPDVAADIRRMAVAAEREAIAELVESYPPTTRPANEWLGVAGVCERLAAAIRNRGETQ